MLFFRNRKLIANYKVVTQRIIKINQLYSGTDRFAVALVFLSNTLHQHLIKRLVAVNQTLVRQRNHLSQSMRFDFIGNGRIEIINRGFKPVIQNNIGKVFSFGFLVFRRKINIALFL